MIYGLLPEKIEPDHWVLGSGKATERFGPGELMPEGHGWKKYLPKKEMQRKNGVETYACTVFAAHNCWETLANYHGYTDFPHNCSDRFGGIVANVGPEGNPPHVTCEAIRDAGVIPEDMLPFDSTVDSRKKFYSPNPPTRDMTEAGLAMLKKFVFGHEWVINEWSGLVPDRPTALIEALGRGTVAVSVRAWHEGTDGLYYKSPGEFDNHFVQLVDYREGKYWLVYDTYERVFKKLTWDYKFQMAKLFFLDRRVPESTIQKMIRDLYAEIARLLKQLS